MSRYRDPKRHVVKKYSYLFSLERKFCSSCYLNKSCTSNIILFFGVIMVIAKRYNRDRQAKS